VYDRAVELRAAGCGYEEVAATLRSEYSSERNVTKHAVAALIRRGAPKRADARETGLSPRTVRYIHTIIHAALKDALRWNGVVRKVADAATPPSAAAARSSRPKAWTAEQPADFPGLRSREPAIAGVDLSRHLRMPAG
jgi:hypothetical protein